MKHFNQIEASFEPEKIKAKLEELKSQNKTMILATKTKENEVETSYAPYIHADNKYYIILSEIATHYYNITETKAFQGMILEDEASAVNTFFRKRAIFDFKYESQNEEEHIKQQFLKTHGPLVEKLLTMDFHIFELNLVKGRVILGPGQAFRLDQDEIIVEQITSK